MTQQLVCDALTMALFRRGFPKNTIIHSDRGSQYGSQRYQQLIRSNGLCGSMGRRATCYDNAVTESFFHTLKVELVHRERYVTRRRPNPVSLHTSKRIIIGRDNTLRLGIRSRWYSRRQLNPVSDVVGEDQCIETLEKIKGNGNTVKAT